MKATLSPVIQHIVQYTISSSDAVEKLNRGIKRYRRMLEFARGAVHIAEIEFGIADMLITRDDPYDWREAARLYNDILERATYGYLRGAALAGKAELAIRKTDAADIALAISWAQEAHVILHKFMGDHDFFTLKSLVVEAELRLKRNGKGDRVRAVNRLQKVAQNLKAVPYWRARALVGVAENKAFGALSLPIKMCQTAMALLDDRPKDYFFLKARLVESELRLRRGTTADKKYAHPSFLKVAGDASDLPSLRARALLDAAGQAKPDKARKLCEDVKKMDALEPYLTDRADAILKNISNAGRKK